MGSNTSSLGGLDTASSMQDMLGSEMFNSGMSLLNSGISAYSAYTAGRVRSQFLQLQARQQEFQANQYKLQGEQQSNVLRTQLLNNLASVNASFAARGVDVGGGSAAALRIQNIMNTEADIKMIRENAELGAIGMQGQAGVSRAAASGARAMGISRAGQALFGESSQRALGSLLGGL